MQIIAVQARVLRRLVAENAFELFVLGPVVLGAISWVSYRYLATLRSSVAAFLDISDPGMLAAALGLIFALCQWPASLAALYGKAHRGEDLLDSLPVPEPVRALAIEVQAAGRALLPTVVFLAVLAALAAGLSAPGSEPLSGATGAAATGPALGGGWWIGFGLPITFLAMFYLALLDLALALVLIRLGWARAWHLGTLGVLAAAALLTPWPPLRALLAPFAVAGEALRRALSAAAGAAPLAEPFCPGPLLVSTCLVASLTLALSIRFRRPDLEKGRALGRARPRGRDGNLVPRSGVMHLGPLLRRPFEERLHPAVMAQVRRDLRLVLRRFSPAVHVAFGLSIVLTAGVALLGQDPAFEPEVRRRILISGFGLSVLAAVSVLPFLLAYQLRVFWIEKSSGLERSHVWQSKVITSCCLAVLPALVGFGLLAILAPGSTPEVLVACLQYFAIILVMSPLLGLTSFEMAEEPRIGLLYGAFLGMAISALFVFYALGWWLWLIAGAFLGNLLAQRADRRLMFLEVEK